jgi:hypothetical protein
MTESPMTFTRTNCRGVTYGREPYDLYTYATGVMGWTPLQLKLYAASRTVRALLGANGGR